jgi:hypothetical protein
MTTQTTEKEGKSENEFFITIFPLPVHGEVAFDTIYLLPF